jgi:chemotaxis protein CheD
MQNVSARRRDELAAIGLGSRIGLALIDIGADVVDLAHDVLSEAQGAAGPAGKFGDLVAPALVRMLEAAGANRRRLQAVLVGGAQMFALGSISDIGARNAVAVRAALKSAGIPVHGEDIGGNRGRTARITIGQTVTSQLAGDAPAATTRRGHGAAHGRLHTTDEVHQPLIKPFSPKGSDSWPAYS